MTVESMQEIRTITHQVYTTWYIKKASQKKEPPGNQPWLSNTFENGSISIITSIRRSQQKSHYP